MDLRRLGELIAPVRCGGCGDALAPGGAGRAWCQHCWVRCGPPVGAWAPSPGGCAGWSAAAYRGPVRRAVLTAKTGAPGALVELLLARWPAGQLPDGAEITWVPGHPLRTFAAPDSGCALAAALADREEGLRLRRLLTRSPLGRRQARRTTEDRRAGAARLGLRVVARPAGAVALIDDVRTTGASLDHAAGLLLAAGAASVFAITVAAAPSELGR